MRAKLEKKGQNKEKATKISKENKEKNIEGKNKTEQLLNEEETKGMRRWSQRMKKKVKTKGKEK